MPVTPAWRILPMLAGMRIIELPVQAIRHPVPESQTTACTRCPRALIGKPVQTYWLADGSRSSRRRLLAASATTIVSVNPSTAIPTGMGDSCPASWKAVRS